MAYDEQTYTDGWETYSKWIDNLREKSEIFSKYDGQNEFKNSLKACQTNYERFRLFWCNPEIRQEINKHCLEDCTMNNERRRKKLNEKSIEESKRMRDIGNKLFKDGNFKKAVQKYTESIKYAPYPNQDCDDNSLALALANRSAALFAKAKYRLCLQDIELALKYGYPDANKFKLLIRKVKCLHILSVWSNDVEQIKEYLRNLIQKPGTQEFIKNEVNAMFEFIGQDLPEHLTHNESDAEDENAVKISNVSKSLPQAADCVEMSFDLEKGRYLLTNKDVSYGRLLIAEDPFVCNLASVYRDRHCYKCFERIHSCGVCCENCTQVLYCSIECLKTNKDIHKFECNQLLDFHEKLGVAYLVLHILFKVNFNLDSIPIHSKKTVEERTLDDILHIESSNWPDLVYKNGYAAVLSLMDHAEDFDYDALMGFGLTAAYLVSLLTQYSDVVGEHILSEEFQVVIGSILLKHIMQLQTNLISILSQKEDDFVMCGWRVEDFEERPIGVGLYPTISLLNHSCKPNIMSQFHRNKFVVRAAQSLECGSEINYCYGPNYSRMSRKDRQARLSEQYFFTCKCECCSKDIENMSRALICPQCNGGVIHNQDMTHKCHSCHLENFMDVRHHLAVVKELLDKFEKLDSQSCNSIDLKTKLKRLEEIESQLSKLIHWRNPIFATIKSRKTQAAEDEEDFDLAASYFKEEMELCAKINGEESVECIMAKLHYIHLEWQRIYYKAEASTNPTQRREAITELDALLATAGSTRNKLKDLLNSTNISGAESSFDTEFGFLSETIKNINKYLLENPVPEL